ncbi:MAG: (Fe-S)-binding protein [Elusimicrobia bacterium]|nr:(Fe-S)-binding protein [Elusimicrobiota bacterium]
MGNLLHRLITDLGERSDYDAASQCCRCGYCEQACPTYVVTGDETRSARGRNQLVRLLIEGRLSDPASAEDALHTCLLCGACTAACYARVATADIVLEGRRKLTETPHRLARLLTRLLAEHRGLLMLLLKAANLAKRLGLTALARPALRLIGLPGLALAEEHVREAPLVFLEEVLRRRPAVKDPRWSYFAPCGPNFLYPRVGLATVAVLESLRGPGVFMDNGCCGLLAYNYGELDDARAMARRVIERFEASGSRGPVVGDCSSCTAFLKSYPQLFLSEPDWKVRAERFAAAVRDVPEVLADAPLPELAGLPAFTYHDSCRACHGQGLQTAAHAAARRLAGSAYRELPESDMCCGGAGAYAFRNPALSDDLIQRKAGRIAASGARLVAASGTSCLIQLAQGLKKYYPECEVVHLSELAARALAQGAKDGTPAGA